MRRHEMTEAQWELIKPLLPGQAGDPGRTAEDSRAVCHDILEFCARVLATPGMQHQTEEARTAT